MTEIEREREESTLCDIFKDSERVKRSYQLCSTDRLIKRNPDCVCESANVFVCFAALFFWQFKTWSANIFSLTLSACPGSR